ncbi:MAG: hypothetical protein QXE01_07235 [Sulfolobales archaeon]
MKSDERLVEIVSECLKVLEECVGRWITFGTKNRNKCRDLLVQSRGECSCLQLHL